MKNFNRRFIFFSLVFFIFSSLISQNKDETKFIPFDYGVLRPLLNFNKHLYPTLFDTHSVLVKTEKISADISYLYVDLKYNSDEMKIIEMGACKDLRKIPASMMVEGKQMRLIAPFWKLFWHYLVRYNVPVWQIAPSKNGLNNFKQMGGRYTSSLSNLHDDFYFLYHHKRKDSFQKQDIDCFKGIVINQSRTTRQHSRLTKRFKKKYSQFIVLDDAFERYKKKGNWLSHLLNTQQLRQFQKL